MRSSWRLMLTMAVATFIAIYLPRLVRACAFPALELIYVNTLHPDLPIGPYEQGNLGIIQPTYGSIYLYVAYRNLVGRPIQSSEEEALWNGDPRITTVQTISRPRRVVMPTTRVEVRSHYATPEEIRESMERSRGLRNPPSPFEGRTPGATSSQAPAPAPAALAPGPAEPSWMAFSPREIFRQIDIHENGMSWFFQFANCNEDAFEQADKTHERLTQQYGEASPAVHDWIEAQNTVFANCPGGPAQIPEELPAGVPAAVRADRAYQIAAAHFYAMEYDQAASQFRAIAADRSSPWSTLAPYLVARALVRKATVTDKLEPDFATLAQAETQVESVLADARLAPYHHAAKNLRGFIMFRLHPEVRMVELADNLLQGSRDVNLAQDVIDFKRLFRHAPIGFYRGLQESPEESRARLAHMRAKSDLLDWMLTLQSTFPHPYDHAREKWESTHSPAWLVAALLEAEPGSPQLSDLLAAANQISPRSPGYASVTFHRLRLLWLQGKRSEGREQLAHLPIRRMGVLGPDLATPPSTVNLFIALHSALAQNLNEWLENAPRVPATLSDILTPQQLPETSPNIAPASFEPAAPRFDNDSLVVLNRLFPLALLEQVAHSPKLPGELRHQVALAAWTRAVLLDDTAVARALTPDVESLVPQLTSSIQAYQSATTADDRRFAAALVMLRFPGLSPFITMIARSTPVDEIENSCGSWWALGKPAEVNGWVATDSEPVTASQFARWPRVQRALWSIYPDGEMPPPAFLTAAQNAAAGQEWRQLLEIGVAPDYLSRTAIAWAKTHPRDPRAPEALALAVRSTRWGCGDKQTGQYSKTAFDLLHNRYPQSTWAQNTKYWFK